MNQLEGADKTQAKCIVEETCSFRFNTRMVGTDSPSDATQKFFSRDEFDFEKRLWTIPSERRKTRGKTSETHLVALTDLNFQLLEEIRSTVLVSCTRHRWDKGRIFYSSIDHRLDDLKVPEVTEIIKREVAWAAQKNDV